MAKAPLPIDPIAEARRLWVEHGWEEAATGMAAVTSIMRAQQIMLGRVDEQLKEFDLTFARYEVLMLLKFSSRGALPLKVVGSRLQVHPTSVTSAVDKLEEQGLVRREQHAKDRRVKLAVLTVKGRARAVEATTRLNESVFADPGLGANEADGLVSLLRDLRKNAGDF